MLPSGFLFEDTFLFGFPTYRFYMLYQYISILSLSNSLFIYTCSKTFSVTNMATKIFSVATLPMLYDQN